MSKDFTGRPPGPPDDDLNDTPHGRTDEEAGMPRLADLQATDALLDRLGGRSVGDADLADPTVADLAALITFVDERALPDLRLEGLLQVLDGRPLYPIREDHRAAVDPADQPIDLTGPAEAGAAVEAGPTRVIDVSQEPAADVRRARPARPEEPAARSTQDVVSLAAARLRRITGRTEDGDALPNWQRMLGKAAVPAAAVILAVGLGGGVTAAVTGNPMAPLDGISEVASQLPGMKPKADRQLESAQQDLADARRLASENRPGEAREALARAESKLKDVPTEKQNDLPGQIALVKAGLETPSTPDAPAGGVQPTTSTSVPEPSGVATVPEQSVQPSATAPSTSPTTTPSPVTPKPSASSTAPPTSATEASGGGAGGDTDPSDPTGAAAGNSVP